MGKEITSIRWIWLVRIWLSVPIVLWIPSLVAFVYPEKPAESQPLFWVIVVCLACLLIWRDSRTYRKQKLFAPALINWVFLIAILLNLSVPLVRWFKAGPLGMPPVFSPVLFLCIAVTAIPYCLFLRIGIPARKESTSSTGQ